MRWPWKRPRVGNVWLQLLGRHGVFSAIVEREREGALIGAIVLEELDLLVDCTSQSLHPREPGGILAEIDQPAALLPRRTIDVPRGTSVYSRDFAAGQVAVPRFPSAEGDRHIFRPETARKMSQSPARERLRGEAHFSAVRRVRRTTHNGSKKEPVPGL